MYSHAARVRENEPDREAGGSRLLAGFGSHPDHNEDADVDGDHHGVSAGHVDADE